ncbi:MAG: MarR family winged helix-turn-helix transcriptional regulator [Thermoleophilia bacterium]
MNALELFILGRKLMKLGAEALPKGSLPASVRSVLIDVATHPDSSITDITVRTGFPQSHVSAAVAKLRDGGALVTERDPADHRRTLVRVSPETIRRWARRGAVPIDATLDRALESDDPAEIAEIVAALQLLAQRLTPKAGARIRSLTTS